MSTRTGDFWIALGAGWLCPGAGQLYARRPGRALFAAMAFALFVIPAAIEIPLMLASPFALALSGYALGFAMLLLVPIDGAFQALRREERPPVRWPRWIGQVVLAFVLVSAMFGLVVPHLPLRRFRIPAPSMQPTLQVGDLIASDMRPVRLASLRVGDIVIFELPEEPPILVMKRIAGLPGDTVEVREGILVLNGEPLGSAPTGYGTVTETAGPGRIYAIQRSPVRMEGDSPPQTVPPGRCFILGDSRMNSRDSRVFGFIPEAALRGRPLAIHWSSDPKTGAIRWDRIGRSLRPAAHP